MRVVVVGDALLDRDLEGRAERLAPDAPVPVVDRIVDRPRPGGAGLAAVLAARAGAEVTLVCALGDDAPGRSVAALLSEAGVRVCDLGASGATAEKVRVRAGGRVLVRLDSGGDGGSGPMTREAAAALAGASAVLVSDYGRGVAAEPSVRQALAGVAAPIVWDPHPRGPAPIPGVLLATPNESEAVRGSVPFMKGTDPFRTAEGPEPLAAAEARVRGSVPSMKGTDPFRRVEGSGPLGAAEAAGRALVVGWRAVNVCVTRGARGALLVAGNGPALAVPAPRVPAGDPCGAGDRFAATAATTLAAGALPSEAVQAAVVAASAFVAAGGAAGVAADTTDAVPPLRRESAAELAARVRADGGTVVATGGCFDLLHAGHVSMLESARALGDCLIVCLNSDASVRRLKGPDRPLVGEDDRAAVLTGLACVDAVAVFEEDDPSNVLEAIRPHVWAKGGDYAIADLPEAAVLAAWGGRAVIVPYVSGRSTTRLIEVARGADRPLEVGRAR